MLKMYLKVKYCEVNRKSKIQIANSTHDPDQNMENKKNSSYCISHAEEKFINIA
jgi:hypothetical protein